VRKSGKVLIVHEDSVTGGVGAEIAATIADESFHDLDAPVRRVGAADVPVPFAPTLEEAVLPDTGRILGAMKELARF
jgi:pyruvate/2-oxoglutarate/acetoin dehydrogenase E1 component